MTCKDCLHYELCSYNTYEQAKYFGKDKEVYITIRNHSVCKFFKPTADVVEVRHRQWLPSDPESDVRFLCSECEKEISTSWDYDPDDMWRYCPCCGAKMDGERRENGT